MSISIRPLSSNSTRRIFSSPPTPFIYFYDYNVFLVRNYVRSSASRLRLTPAKHAFLAEVQVQKPIVVPVLVVDLRHLSRHDRCFAVSQLEIDRLVRRQPSVAAVGC